MQVGRRPRDVGKFHKLIIVIVAGKVGRMILNFRDHDWADSSTRIGAAKRRRAESNKVDTDTGRHSAVGVPVKWPIMRLRLKTVMGEIHPSAARLIELEGQCAVIREPVAAGGEDGASR